MSLRSLPALLRADPTLTAVAGRGAAVLAVPEPARAFTTYLSVLDQWRTLPFRDPGLPAEVLAPDWHGPAATAVFAPEIVRRGAIAGGLIWHFARPPVEGLDFEVDVRGVATELVI